MAISMQQHSHFIWHFSGSLGLADAPQSSSRKLVMTTALDFLACQMPFLVTTPQRQAVSMQQKTELFQVNANKKLVKK